LAQDLHQRRRNRLRQIVIHEPYQAVTVNFAVHGQPAGQRRNWQIGQQAAQAGPLAGVVVHGKTDAGAGGEQAAIHNVVVGAQGEVFGAHGQAGQAEAAPQAVVAVHADQAVLQKLLQPGGGAGAAQVVFVGIGAYAHVANLARHQRALRGPHHTHGDIGIAPQQVGDLVGGDKLDGDAGLLLL